MARLAARKPRWPRRNKFNAVRVKADGISFDSKLEYRVYQELKVREKAGEIRDLDVHPRYPIVYEGSNVCLVILDFVYFDIKEGRTRFVDAKGLYTPTSRLKHKLFKAFYGQEVEILR